MEMFHLATGQGQFACQATLLPLYCFTLWVEGVLYKHLRQYLSPCLNMPCVQFCLSPMSTDLLHPVQLPSHVVTKLSTSYLVSQIKRPVPKLYSLWMAGSKAGRRLRLCFLIGHDNSWTWKEAII